VLVWADIRREVDTTQGFVHGCVHSVGRFSSLKSHPEGPVFKLALTLLPLSPAVPREAKVVMLHVHASRRSRVMNGVMSGLMEADA